MKNNEKAPVQKDVLQLFLMRKMKKVPVVFVLSHTSGPPRAYTVKKRLANFPFPAGMSLTKLSLAGNNSIIPGQGEFG